MSDSPLTLPRRMKLEVAILGGGFAGVYCGQRIAKALKKAGRLPEEAIIVSEQNYMVFQPMLAEVAGASIAPRHVINPIRRLCRGLRVLRGKVLEIDLVRKEVHVDTGNFSAGVIIEYNHLVLGLGAEIDLSRVPGMPEHALVMQNVGDAMILRATIISRIEEANAEARDEVRKRLLTFVVVGGGYSGVETAGEILDLIYESARYYRGLDKKDMRVVLIHSRERILHTLGDSLGDYAARKLRKRGLEIILEERVRAVTSSRVYLQSGATIETNTVISTVGNAPNKAIQALCNSSEIQHDHFRLLTDEYLRVQGQENIWAAGDCALIPLEGKPGESCPQTAQFAMREGICLADNIGLLLRGKALKPFTFKGLGELASIGHRTAVASIMGMQFSGFVAWFLWRTIYLSKLPGLDRKLRIMIDWTLDLFFPRDINLLSPRYTKLFKQVHLEPDDILFNRGEPAFSLYVVQSGEIVLKDHEGKIVRTIEEGDFFGERALVHGGGYLYDAVAKGSTELVSLSGEVVLPFFRSSRRFRRVLANTTTQGTAESEVEAIMTKLDPSVLKRPVSAVMRTDLATLRIDETVNDALALFRERRFSVYPLVDENGQVAGTLAREDLFDFLKRDEVGDDTSISGIERYDLPECTSGELVESALEKMIRSGRYKCIVTDEANRLIGMIAVMDLFGTELEKPNPVG